MSARSITVLGATGSVGLATLDLIAAAAPGRFTVRALTANTRAAELARLALRFKPDFVALGDAHSAPILAEALAGSGIEWGAGEDAVRHAAGLGADWTMAAIVGAAGLRPTLEAVNAGGAVAFANKEALVCAGELLMDAAARSGAALLPVDSEHNAIFQALGAGRKDGVRRIILTASGGPFRESSREAMAAARLEDALAHPTWSMGAKISIDCATMMNKGLEIIEACHLFGLPQTEVDVLVHPESIIHGLVEYVDGGLLAQMGAPDMRTPIAHALGWPDRLETDVARLDLARIACLNFYAPDAARFPALSLARSAFEAGGAAPAILNAANEVAVQAFLDRRIGFLDIASTVSEALDRAETDDETPRAITGFDAVFSADAAGRRLADQAVERLSGALRDSG